MVRLSIAALALTLATACKDSKPAPRTGPSQLELYAKAELDAFEKDLDARLDANAKRTCPRPLLRGTPRPGPADEDIVALFEPTGPLAACYGKIEAAQKVAKLEEQVEQRSAGVVAIDGECGELFVTAFSNVAAHEDACSPYQPGRRREAKQITRPVLAAQMLGLRARIVADKDPAAGLWLLATSLRAFQDAGRGHVTLLTSLTLAAASGVLLGNVARILETATLEPKIAGELASAFDALVASEPRFHDTLQGDQEWKALHGGLIRYMPQTWTPKGGALDPDPRKNGVPALARGSRISARDSGGLMLQSAREAATGLAEACPPTASYSACRTGVELRAAKRATIPRVANVLIDPETVLAKLAKKPGVDAKEEIKRLAVDTLEPALHFKYVELLDQKAQVLWRLVAAQIALATRAAGCKATEPTKAATDLFGEPFVVHLEASELRVTPPGFARPGGATWKSKCP